MKHILSIILNSAAIAASISAYLLSLLHLWKGEPSTREKRLGQAKKSVLLSASLIITLAILSFNLKHAIETNVQTGSFREYQRGEVEIFYPIRFKSTPNLQFSKTIMSTHSTSGPRIMEQRPDGFKVYLDLDSHMYDWKATGVLETPK